MPGPVSIRMPGSIGLHLAVFKDAFGLERVIPVPIGQFPGEWLVFGIPVIYLVQVIGVTYFRDGRIFIIIGSLQFREGSQYFIEYIVDIPAFALLRPVLAGGKEQCCGRYQQ